MRRLVYLFVIFLSCDKTVDIPYSLSDLKNCYKQQSYNDQSLKSKLIGRWAWKFVQCGGCEEFHSDSEEKDLEVAFNQDNLIEIYRHENLIYEGEWLLEPSPEEGYYRMIINPSFTINLHVGLYGDIIVCEDDLLFYISYVDGYDNYFKRIVL